MFFHFQMPPKGASENTQHVEDQTEPCVVDSSFELISKEPVERFLNQDLEKLCVGIHVAGMVREVPAMHCRDYVVPTPE